MRSVREQLGEGMALGYRAIGGRRGLRLWASLTIAYLFVVAIAVALDWWWLAVFSVPAVVTVWVYLDYRRQVANRRASHRDR